MKKKLLTIALAIALVMTVFVFVACDNNGGGTTPTPLAAPANLQVADGNLTWSAVPNAQSYNVRIGTTGTATPVLEGTTFALPTTLTAGTTYRLYVKAMGDGSNSSDSSWSAHFNHKVSSGEPPHAILGAFVGALSQERINDMLDLSDTVDLSTSQTAHQSFLNVGGLSAEVDWAGEKVTVKMDNEARIFQVFENHQNMLVDNEWWYYKDGNLMTSQEFYAGASGARSSYWPVMVALGWEINILLNFWAEEEGVEVAFVGREYANGYTLIFDGDVDSVAMYFNMIFDKQGRVISLKMDIEGLIVTASTTYVEPTINWPQGLNIN
ncbi:MAG: hypothetical protein FWD82_09335 [Defluviitaleaceae bacterium]|nr:hypothetical protein [Defluviitaleaceae bacterium]